MNYVTAIPVHSRTYTFGIRDNKFLLSNLDDKTDQEWDTMPIDVNLLEGYTPLVANARNRLFMVADDSGANKWLAVQTRNQCLMISAPWRDIMKWLRVNIVDLGGGVYYVKHLAANYHMGLGNFYLYPELNPLNLPLIRYPESRSVTEILASVNEVLPIPEIREHLPLGKMGRFTKGLVVSGPHVWWIDKREGLAYYLNEYFFEGSLSFRKFLEEGDADTGLFSLPRDRDGTWDSPVITKEMVNSLFSDHFEIFTATGTRIVTNKKADRDSSGDYTITGYGRFGRAELPDRVITLIRSKLGSNLGLELRSERFVGFYNISDIKAIYLRENVQWVEPVVKNPMTEPTEPTIEIEAAAPNQDSVYQPGQQPGGWQFPGEQQTTVQEEVVNKSIEEKSSETTILLDVAKGTMHMEQGDTKVTIIDGRAELVAPSINDSGDQFIKEKIETSDDTVELDMTYVKYHLGKSPIICHTFITNHPDITPTPMLLGNTVLIDIGGVYGNLVPWEHIGPGQLADGTLVSNSTGTLLVLDGEAYLAAMHVNL